MAWIKSYDTLSDHHKTFRLASELSVPIPYAIGTVHLLWWFTLKQAWRDGDLSNYTKLAIAKACHWDNDPEILIISLQKSGFLNGMKVHDWLDFSGRLVHDRINYEKENKTRTVSVRRPYGFRSQDKIRLDKIRREKKIHIPTIKFEKPTIKEIQTYCGERSNGVNPEKFFNFYEAKGWMIGKNKIKDWQACVRTWEKGDITQNKGDQRVIL